MIMLHPVSIFINIMGVIASVSVFPIWVNLILILLILPNFVEQYNKLSRVR